MIVSASQNYILALFIDTNEAFNAVGKHMEWKFPILPSMLQAVSTICKLH